MSKVKIQGHASGTGVLTVTAPNTSTDRTITLPDSTGTILDSTSTLDATKLSGALPALDGSSLTGTGSPSITDNGSSTAMTIISDGTVCIGETSAILGLATQLSVRQNNGNGYAATFLNDGNDANRWGLAVAAGSDTGSGTSNLMTWMDGDGTILDKVTHTGGAVSYGGQNTAKAWCSFQGNSTVTIKDSHNVSSVTDNGSGDYSINFSNNMANTNYSFLATSGNAQSTETDGHTGISMYDEASAFAVGSIRFRAIRWKFNDQLVTDPKRVCALVFGD